MRGRILTSDGTIYDANPPPSSPTVCFRNLSDRLLSCVQVKVEWTKGDGGRWIMAEVPGTEKTYECDYVFLAMGFLGPQQDIGDQLKIKQDGRSNFEAVYGKFATSEPGVYAAGDCRRGQSLVVWAIAEGRGAAREIDRMLMGDTQVSPFYTTCTPTFLDLAPLALPHMIRGCVF